MYYILTCDSSLANLEMRIILARLIWRFDLKLAPSSEEWMEGQQVFDVWGKPPLNVYLTSVSR
jgi:cytochrome P450